MKAIILAAGYATRLYPLTINTPKALLPINKKPIIDYIVDELNTISEIDEIYVVTNRRFAQHFTDWAKTAPGKTPISVLDDGTTSDENKKGAVGDIGFVIAEKKIDDELLVIAGDNFFTYSLRDYVDYYREKDHDCVCVKKWPNKKELSQFGVALLDENGKVLDIEEKPKEPKSDTAVFATYLYKRKQCPCSGNIWMGATIPTRRGTSPHGCTNAKTCTPTHSPENVMTSAHRKATGKFAACMKNKKQRLLPPFLAEVRQKKPTQRVGFFFVVERTIRRQKNMEWIEVFVATSQMGLEPVEGVLYQCGLNGLMIHDEADFAEFLENPNREWDYVADELVEEKQEQTTGITFFLRDNLYGREQLSQIKSALQSVKETEKELDLGSLEVTMKNVAEEDWANNWKKYFKPFPVGDKIMIKPSWEELPAQTDKIILKIDPGHIFRYRHPRNHTAVHGTHRKICEERRYGAGYWLRQRYPVHRFFAAGRKGSRRGGY